MHKNIHLASMDRGMKWNKVWLLFSPIEPSLCKKDSNTWDSSLNLLFIIKEIGYK